MTGRPPSHSAEGFSRFNCNTNHTLQLINQQHCRLPQWHWRCDAALSEQQQCATQQRCSYFCLLQCCRRMKHYCCCRCYYHMFPFVALPPAGIRLISVTRTCTALGGSQHSSACAAQSATHTPDDVAGSTCTDTRLECSLQAQHT